MKRTSEIATVLFLFSGCGDSGGTATTSTGATTTMAGSGGPSSGMTEDPSTTSGPTTTNGTSSTMSTPPTAGTSTEEGGPKFLSFNTNVTKISEGESVTFTALLTDPDGIDDIVGGSLLSADEVIDFGPLVAAGQDGSYSISLSWAQIHQSDPISFESSEPKRVFRARFFDQKGNKTARDAEISLFCADGSACEGACTNLDADGANCGACAHSCASKGCQAGSCAPNLSECVSDAEGFQTCAQICESIGETCAKAQCDGATAKHFNDSQDCKNDVAGVLIDEPCDKVQIWIDPQIKCCCTDSK